MSKVVLPPLPQGYEPHELPADYTGPLWIEGQLRARDLEVARVVLEAAAKECVKSRDFGDEYASPFVVIANAIRALEVKHG